MSESNSAGDILVPAYLKAQRTHGDVDIPTDGAGTFDKVFGYGCPKEHLDVLNSIWKSGQLKILKTSGKSDRQRTRAGRERGYAYKLQNHRLPIHLNGRDNRYIYVYSIYP
ncbi:hypothetical protein GCM10011323_27310 [Pontibacter amylolyticus]|uniref:Uncharacterized protein n=1 Tax=Pontibacter amylolyticus TaxID=1424080 RepID=A0ABQ1WAV8_9BACT|nr:hypothetical protein GCM10011323_27310 [Pontibacter amylolyticus]